MQRTLLIVIATAVVAAALATGATILFTDDDAEVAITSPLVTPTPDATLEVITPSPEADPSPSPTATGTTAATTPAPPATVTVRPSTRTASSVNCRTEETYCSQTHGARVEERRRVSYTADSEDIRYSGVPTIDMESQVRDRDDETASVGERVKAIHVEVVVENTTNDTFVFPKREIVLEIFRNGRLYDRLATTGPGFDMTPGAKMNGTFDRPITEDGTYTWRAKTYYYEK